jgi:26S proteasome regulatory subunit N6
LVQGVLQDYREQLEGDPIVNRHLNDLFKALLEQNLIRVITPYSKVQIKHLAKLISLDSATVEREVSQMILDKKIAGAYTCVATVAHASLDSVKFKPECCCVFA